MITLSLAVSLGVWVFVDSITRKANFLPWAIGTSILPPFVLPFYLAKRPLRAGEVREGGLAYNVLKNFVIVWTILMAAVTLLSAAAVTGNTTGLRNEFEAAITAIGATLWLALLAAIWVFPFLGAVGIAFLLKKSSIVEKGPTGPLALHAEQKRLALPGWSAWAAVAILWGIAILAILGVTAFRPYYTERQLHAEEPDSPLVQAASRGDSKAVRALVKEGADINEGLALAVKHRHEEAIRVLLANGADLNSSLYHAAIVKDAAAMEALISGGADVDFRSQRGLTLLYQIFDPKTMEFLLSKGANIEARAGNIVGNTPLMSRVLLGHMPGVEVLIAHGANVDARNRSGDTALTYVSQFCPSGARLQAVEAILRHGANANARDFAGRTAVFYIIRSIENGMCDEPEAYEALRVLRRYGAR